MDDKTTTPDTQVPDSTATLEARVAPENETVPTDRPEDESPVVQEPQKDTTTVKEPELPKPEVTSDAKPETATVESPKEPEVVVAENKNLDKGGNVIFDNAEFNKTSLYSNKPKEPAKVANSDYQRGLRNFNPGALRQGKGQTSIADGFAVFPDMTTGWNALLRQLKLYQGTQPGEKTGTGVTGDYTLAQVMEVYSPKTENNTEGYITTLEKFFKSSGYDITRDTPIKDIPTEQWAAAIARVETPQAYYVLAQNGFIPEDIADTLSKSVSTTDVAAAEFYLNNLESLGVEEKEIINKPLQITYGSSGLQLGISEGGVQRYVGYSPDFAMSNLRETQAAKNQTPGEKILNGTLYQGLIGEVFGGALEGFGSLGLIGDPGGTNMLTRMGGATREDMQTYAPIFQYNPQKSFQWADPGWWGTNIPNILSTFSLLIPGYSGMKAASYLARAAKLGKGYRKAFKASQIQAKAAGRLAEGFNMAAFMRHAENTREGADVFLRAESEFLNSSMTVSEMEGTMAYKNFVAKNGRAPRNKYELAEYVGDRAAMRSYAINSTNLFFDLIQVGSIMRLGRAAQLARRTGRRASTTRRAIREGGNATKGMVMPSWAKTYAQKLGKVGKFGLVSGSEGVEEMVNFYGAEEGVALAHRLQNNFIGSHSDRLNNYVQDDRFWESAFFGMFGGGVFNGLGSLISKKDNTELEHYKETHNIIQTFIKQHSTLTKEGKYKEADKVKQDMLSFLGQRATVAGRIDQLVEQIQSEEFMGELSRMGLGTKEELMAEQDAMVESLRAEEATIKEAIEVGRKKGLSEDAIGYYIARYANTVKDIRQQEAIMEELKNQGIELPSGNRKNYARKTMLQQLRTEREVIQSLLEDPRLKNDDTRRAMLEDRIAQYEAIEGQIEADLLAEDVDLNEVKDEKKEITDEEKTAMMEELGLNAIKQRLAYMQSDEGIEEIEEAAEQDRITREENSEKLALATIKKTSDKKVLKDIIKRAKMMGKDTILKAAKQRLEDLKKNKGKKQEPPTPPGKTENPQAVAEAEAMLANMAALTEFVLEPGHPKNPGKVPNAYYDTRTDKYYTRVSKVVSSEELDTSAPQLQSALILGNVVDQIVRDFFANTLVKEVAMQRLMNMDVPEAEARFDAFLAQLQQLRQDFQETGETAYTEDLLLVNQELGIAGSADLITIDKQGNVRIYDMKTMKHSLQDVHQSGANKGESKFDTPYNIGELSKRERYQRQLSLYRILMANSYGFVAKDLNIIAIRLKYPSAENTLVQEVSDIQLQTIVPLDPLDTVEGRKLKPARSESAVRGQLKPLLQELSDIETAIRFASSELDPSELENLKSQRNKKAAAIKDILGNSRLSMSSNMQDISDSIVNKAIEDFVPNFVVITAQGEEVNLYDAIKKDLIQADEAMENLNQIAGAILEGLEKGETFAKIISQVNAQSEQKRVVLDEASSKNLSNVFTINNTLFSLTEELNLQPFGNHIIRVAREIQGAAESLDRTIQREGMIVPDGVAIYMDQLFEALTKGGPLTVGDDLFGLGFLETRLKEGDSLELNEEQARIWGLILQVIEAQNEGEQTNVKITIEKDDTEYKSPEKVSSVKLNKGVNTKGQGLEGLKKLQHNPNNKDSTEFKYDVDPGSETNWVIFAKIGGEKVRLGYLPKINTLMGQAQRQQEAFNKESITLNLKDQMHLNTHTHAIDALINIDRLIQLREALAAQNTDTVVLGLAEDVFKFQQLPNDQGSARGNLLRPSADSTVKLGDIVEIRDAINEHGVAVMLPDADGNIRMYSLQTGEAIDNPYQDGLLLEEDGINYGIGQVYAPVYDRGNLIYVRVPKVSLEKMGIDNAVIDLFKDPKLDAATKASKLRQYTVVATPNSTIDTGIVYNEADGSFLLRQNGRDVFRLRHEESGMQALDDSELQDLEMMREFPFSPSIVVSKDGTLIQDLSQVDDYLGGKALIDRLMESVNSPIAPVTNASGETISFTYPGAPNRQEGSRYFPDTERTHIKLRIVAAEKLITSGVPKPSKPTNTEDPSGTDPFFPFGGAFLSHERAMGSGVLNVLATDQDMAEAEAWFAENLPQLGFKRVKGLIVRGGTRAYGVWEQGMLVVSDEAVVGTEYHEAFHAVTDVFLSPARRAKVMAEAERKYTITEKDLEAARAEIIDANPQRDFDTQPITNAELKDYALNEKLAETFREYMVTKGLSMKDKSVIRRFFSELYELVKSIFQRQYQTRRLMQHINKGKFAQKPSQRSLQFMNRFMKAPPFDTPTRKEFEQHLPMAIAKVIDTVFEYKGILETAPSLEQGINNATGYLTKKFGSVEGASDVISIVTNINRLSQEIDPDTGEVVVNNQVKADIAKSMLRLAFRRYGIIHGALHFMREDGVNTDVIDPLIEEMVESSENLVEYFANKTSIRNRIFDSLKADAITGTTAAEQYGGKSMETIDPKSKIPASVRNLIGSVPMLPTSGTSDLRQLLRRSMPSKQKAELLKKLMEKIKEEGKFDKMSRTGLPRVMDFNQVFGYLLHHLNDATSLEDMMYRLEQMSVKNPNLLFLYSKLKTSDKILQTQFFVSMKKADTAELNVSNNVISYYDMYGQQKRELSKAPKVHKAQEPLDVLTNYNRTSIIQTTAEYISDGTFLNRIKALQTFKDREALAEAVQDFGLNTIQIGALEFRLSTMTNSELRAFSTNFIEILKQVEPITQAQDLKTKRIATNKFVAKLRSNILGQLIEVDMGAVALKYRNGEGTYVYSRMLPSYVTEETERLLNDPAHFNKRLEEDPSLRSTSWVSREGTKTSWLSNAHSPFIVRFGYLNNTPYTNLRGAQKLAYDLHALFHRVSQSDGATMELSYVAVPTPSDAENTWLVRSAWHDMKDNEKRELLTRIAREEIAAHGENASIPGLAEAQDPVKHIEAHFEKEVKLIMADPKLRKAADLFVRQRFLEIGQMTDAGPIAGMTFTEHVADHLNDLVTATYISHRDYAHWVSGTHAEFGYNTVKMQKRAKGPQSNGTANARQSARYQDRQTFRSVVIKEPKIDLDWVSQVDRADGVTYMSLQFYRDLLEDHGELTNAKRIAIDKALNNQELNNKDTVALITPYKPMYFGKHKGKTIFLKTAVLPLVPALLRDRKGNPLPERAGLEGMLRYIEAKNLDQAHVESAQKSGEYTPVELFDAQGNFIEDRLDEGIASIVQELPVDHYRHQVHNPQHMSVNNTTGWMTQVSKIVTGNLHGRERVGPRGVSGTKMVTELLRKERKLLSMKHAELLNRFFETELDEEGNSQIKYDGVIPVLKGNKLREFLLDHVDENNQALVEMLRSKDRALNNPMMARPMVNALFSILHRDYKHLKIPGGMQVQMPDLGIKDGLKGMRLEDGKVLPAEVIVSKAFLPAEYRNSPIESIPDRVLTMLAYRIPGEHKNTSAVIKVIGFLPEGQDGMLVPPDFVAQMGSDFDNDKLYLNWKVHKSKEDLSAYESVWNEYLQLVFEVLTDPKIFEEEVLQEQDFVILRNFRETLNQAGKLPGREIEGVNLDTYVEENPYSYLSHQRMFQDNIAGIGLKGISAKNNTFWLNLQRYQIAFDLDADIETPGGKMISRVTWRSLTPDRIRFNAQTVGASMDGAIDPVYGQLGIGLNNFQIWQDLHMIGFTMEEAWEAATDQDSIDYINNELTEEEIENKIQDNWRLKAVIAWNTELSLKLEPLKKLMRIQEEKLSELGTTFIPFLTGQQTFEGVESLLSGAGSPLDITHLPVVKENLDIAQTTLDILMSLGIPYFSEALESSEGITFDQSDRHQKYMASKAFISARRKEGTSSFLRMGELKGVENVSQLRPARKKGQYQTWNIQDFFDYFKSNAGRKKVANDSSLKFVLENLYVRDTAVMASSNLFGVGSGNIFIDVNHHQRIHDPEMGQDFYEAWKELTESEENAVKEFAYALAEYEAERSGWRFGGDTLTKFLPEVFFRELENPIQDPLEIKLLAALSPNVYEIIGKNSHLKAIQTNRMVAVTLDKVQRVYFTVGGQRGYITRPLTSSRFHEDRTMSELRAEFERGVEDTESMSKSEIKEESKVGRSSKPERQFAERKAKLTQLFRDAGVEVKVILDSSIEGAGGVQMVEGKAEIRIHPDKMRSDTLIHEFAHIYIEMLGYNHPLVQQAIKELRGTQLYRDTQALYSEKTTRDLDMEVLATAMGLKGDTVYAEELGVSKIQTVFRRIFRAISKFLSRVMGREVTVDAAEQLARNMFRGKDVHINNLLSFEAEQRLKSHLNEMEMLTGVREVIAERIQHMRRLGISEDEEIKLLETLMNNNRTLGRLTSDMRSQIVGRIADLTEEVVSDTNMLLEQSAGYLDNIKGREWTEIDRQFYNRAYNARQILLNMQQAAVGFNPKAPGEKSRAPSADIARLGQLGDTLTGQVKRIDNVLKEAISEKLKQASADPIIRKLATNIFDLSDDGNLWKYALDSGFWREGFMGSKEQSAVVLKLLSLQVKRTLDRHGLEAQQEISNLNKISKTYLDAGNQWEQILDEDRKRFVSPITGRYYMDRDNSKDVKIFEAENTIQEFTPEYYTKYKHRKRTEEYKALEQEQATIKENAERIGVMSQEDKARLEEIEYMLANVDKKVWKKYHTWEIDLKTYRTDRAAAKAKGEEALRDWDIQYSEVNRAGQRQPKAFSKYKQEKVKDEFRNDQWDPNGGLQVIDKYKNDKYDLLTEVQKQTIQDLKTLMRSALGRDHKFFDRNLIPQFSEGELTVFTELEDKARKLITITGEELQERLDAEDKPVYVRSQPSFLFTRDGQKVMTNLQETIAEFIVSASQQKALDTIETFSLASRDQIDNMRLISSKIDAKSVIGFGKEKQVKKKTIAGSESRAKKSLEHMLQGYFGQGWVDQDAFSKIVDRILTYNSMMGIGLNPSSWLNNFLYGSVQQRIENAGGIYYTNKDSRNARKKIAANYGELHRMAHGKKKAGFVTDNKTVGLIKFFDVTMDQKEISFVRDRMGVWMNRLFYGQNMGEILMQNQVMIAHMLGQKVILADGSETNLYEALNYTAAEGVVLPEGAKIIRPYGEVDLTLDELANFKQKLLSRLQRIHGAYNKEDQGTIARHALGQAGLQYRKWIPHGIFKRFAAEEFSEAREETEIGWYRGFGKMMHTYFMTSYNEKQLMKFSLLMEQYKDQPHVVNAAKRAMYEMMTGMASTAALWLLASMIKIEDSDDDELFLVNDEFYKAKLLYHVERLKKEMLTFVSPFEIGDTLKRIGKDPIPSVRTISFIALAGVEALKAIWTGEWDRFEGGFRYGDVKATSYLARGTFGWKHYTALEESIANHQAYSLYGN